MCIINGDIQVFGDCSPFLFYNTQNRVMSGAATMQVSQQSCQFNSKTIPDRGIPMKFCDKFTTCRRTRTCTYIKILHKIKIRDFEILPLHSF